jgi:hypothetical protein
MALLMNSGDAPSQQGTRSGSLNSKVVSTLSLDVNSSML